MLSRSRRSRSNARSPSSRAPPCPAPPSRGKRGSRRWHSSRGTWRGSTSRRSSTRPPWRARGPPWCRCRTSRGSSARNTKWSCRKRRWGTRSCRSCYRTRGSTRFAQCNSRGKAISWCRRRRPRASRRSSLSPTRWARTRCPPRGRIWISISISERCWLLSCRGQSTQRRRRRRRGRWASAWRSRSVWRRPASSPRSGRPSPASRRPFHRRVCTLAAHGGRTVTSASSSPGPCPGARTNASNGHTTGSSGPRTKTSASPVLMMRRRCRTRSITVTRASPPTAPVAGWVCSGTNTT
mmetsp:Transcript_86764/g.265573  ORF Transcript_86764/g.265573 Transcript_86764/m.265573 type:complete len:295 (-) Transcript_86764:6-890(-)